MGTNSYSPRPRPDQHLVMLPQIVILPQGRTEYHYFKGFESQLVSVAVRRPTSILSDLLARAIEETKAQAERRPDSRRQVGDGVWIVIDRDFRPDNPAADKLFYGIKAGAERAGVNVAYSDDAFELWFLLHYEDVLSPLLASETIAKLKNHYPAYSKPAPEMHKRLLDLGSFVRAADRADRMLARAKVGHRKGQTTNPSTTVHILVNKVVGRD